MKTTQTFMAASLATPEHENGAHLPSIRLAWDMIDVLFGDLDPVSQKMTAALIEGKQPPELMAELAKGRLRAKKEQLKHALVGQLSDRHRFLLARVENHIRWLEAHMAELDGQVVTAMEPYRESWHLLRTIPGIDQLGAAMLLVEMGDDMERFGSKERLSAWTGLCPGNNESAGKKEWPYSIGLWTNRLPFRAKRSCKKSSHAAF